MGGIIGKRNLRRNSETYRHIVNRYGKRCEWLKNDKFLKDLEGDSVDTEILDEELKILEAQEPKTCRGKTVRMLEASPLQVAMCLLVLIDAGVVVAEILLDLHAMKSQQVEATTNLNEALQFLRDQFNNDHIECDHLRYYLDKLQVKFGNGSLPDQVQYDVKTSRRKRYLDNNNATLDRLDSTAEAGRSTSRPSHVTESFLQPPLKHRLKSKNASDPTLPDPEFGLKIPNSDGMVDRNMRGTVEASHLSVVDESWERNRRDVLTSDANDDLLTSIEGERTTNMGVGSANGSGSRLPIVIAFLEKDPASEKRAKNLLKIAHILHYGSIAILGVFVVQVFLKMFAMGGEFFRSKMEIFDGLIILASFTLDLIFLEGITEADGEETIALLVIFLLWRILRVINGMMVSSKKRHEFRIKLQRRACRRAEKKVELVEEEGAWKEKEIHNLKLLCQRNGINEDDIATCRPNRRTTFQKMDTSSGLSSIASLSLGFTMSMRPASTPLAQKRGANNSLGSHSPMFNNTSGGRGRNLLSAEVTSDVQQNRLSIHSIDSRDSVPSNNMSRASGNMLQAEKRSSILALNHPKVLIESYATSSNRDDVSVNVTVESPCQEDGSKNVDDMNARSSIPSTNFHPKRLAYQKRGRAILGSQLSQDTCSETLRVSQGTSDLSVESVQTPTSGIGVSVDDTDSNFKLSIGARDDKSRSPSCPSSAAGSSGASECVARVGGRPGLQSILTHSSNSSQLSECRESPLPPPDDETSKWFPWRRKKTPSPADPTANNRPASVKRSAWHSSFHRKYKKSEAAYL